MSVLLTVAALAVVGWFAAGTIWNVRKGSATMKWLQSGLPLLGERTTVRWLGSTSVEMGIQKADSPFERAAVVIFMEPRDVPWMWALGRWRGRRDTLIVRGELRSAPRADLEVLDAGSWSGRDALRRIGADDWLVREPSPGEALAVHYKTPAALALADAVLESARRAGLTIRRLSLRRSEKSVQLHLALPPRTASADALFRAVRALAERSAG